MGSGTYYLLEKRKTEKLGLPDFKFYPTNHGVARAEWHHPCVPYELSGRNKTGFYSGPRPVDVVLSDVGDGSMISCCQDSTFWFLLSDQPPTWDLLINNTEPIFFYCTAEGSCLKEGMIGVINPVCQLPMRITSLEICADKIIERLYIVGNATIRGTSVHIHGNSWRQDPRRSRHYHQRFKPSNVVVKQILRISDPDINNSSNYDCNRGQFLPTCCGVSWERESQQTVFWCHCRNSRRWSSYRTLIGRFTLPARTSHNNAPIHETTATFCPNGLSRREPYTLPWPQHPNDA